MKYGVTLAVAVVMAFCIPMEARAEDLKCQCSKTVDKNGGDVDWWVDTQSHISGKFTNVSTFNIHINGQFPCRVEAGSLNVLDARLSLG